MTAQHLAETQLVDGIPARRLLEGLARVYRWLLVTDSERRVLWMSDGLSQLFGVGDLEIGSDARAFVPKLPRAEQVFPLRAKLRHRSHVSGIPIQLRGHDGSLVEAEVNVVRVETAEPGRTLLVSIARPRETPREADPGGGIAGALIRECPDAILAVDAYGFVSQANPAAERLTGRTAAQLVGYPAALLFGTNATDIDRIASSFADDHAGESRVALCRPDGGSVSVRIAVRSLGGGCKGLFLCEAGQPEEHELRRAKEELEHCVNSLAHDLRSPLVALLGFSRLLRQEYDPLLDATGRHFLDRMEQAGRTIETLVHDLLELSRIGQPGDRPAMVDPRAVLGQLRAELKPRLDARGIVLGLPDEAPPVLCDRTRLYQLLSNLIGNAIEHMGDVEDPRIEVAVAVVEGGHRVSVSDNGRGVASEKASQIFEAFQSFPRAEGRRGTGMGLAIVKKIAEKRGGRAWVESEPGKGATFHVFLPDSEDG